MRLHIALNSTLPAARLIVPACLLCRWCVQLNVQRNRGLPIFFYKYMRKYRGW